MRVDDSQVAFTIETETGQHIGNLGLMHINWKDRTAKLGIVIGEKTQWGKGCGKDAIRTMLAFVLGEMNLNQIYLRVYAEHTLAINAYRKCGFVEEGCLRQDIYS